MPCGAFPCSSSSLTLQQGNRSVKPGGWVGFQDGDGYPISEDGSLNSTGLHRCYGEAYSAFEKAGHEARPGFQLEQWLKNAGFVNIHVEKFVLPYGISPKDTNLVSFLPLFASKKETINDPVLTSFHTEGSRRLEPGSGRSEPLRRTCPGRSKAVYCKEWKTEEVIVLASQTRADGRKRDIHSLFNL